MYERKVDRSFSTKQGIKRQRTASESIPSNTRKTSHDDDSHEELTATGRPKKSKAEAAVHSSRQSESREKLEERDKIRAEAAGRRQERAGRRRADDEAIEDTPKPSASAKTSPPASSQPTSPPETNGTEALPIKRAPGGRKKKLGNNQYTNKTREASSPHGKKRNLLGTSSGEENLANGDSHQNSTNGTRKNSPDNIPIGKPKIGRGRGKAVNGNGGKHEDPADLTVATMKKRMEAMSAFIARAQVELAGDKTPLRELGSASPAALPGGGAVVPPTPVATSVPGLGGKGLEGMNALEMAEVVSRSIAGWHSQFDHLT